MQDVIKRREVALKAPWRSHTRNLFPGNSFTDFQLVHIRETVTSFHCIQPVTHTHTHTSSYRQPALCRCTEHQSYTQHAKAKLSKLNTSVQDPRSFGFVSMFLVLYLHPRRHKGTIRMFVGGFLSHSACSLFNPDVAHAVPLSKSMPREAEVDSFVHWLKTTGLKEQRDMALIDKRTEHNLPFKPASFRV